MELSERLLSIANMVTPSSVVADVGCDHAFVSIYLVEHEIIPRAIAMDIGVGPLERAKEHVEAAGLTDLIETRLSDGVEALKPNEADCVLIAGMGGPLMQHILKEGALILKDVRELILQPQSEVCQFRHFLQEQGYHILSESMVYEDGKFYPMMKVIHGQMDYQKEVEFQYGRILLQEENPVLNLFLKKERQTLRELLNELDHKEQTERIMIRKSEINAELELISEALKYYQFGRDSWENER
ncbi:MAG: SAM-dependent methyltransferase [Clostridia bacterium]|nr:SAM-dependent methyltransferase [Clostridia bacterium]